MNNRPLVPADETLNHQIVDTFASVGQSDLSWTEKVWIGVHATDGSLEATLGIGKYTNRGVFDGYGGVSRGVEQWTVRASRRLSPRPDLMAVGPITYEVVEPLRTIRAVLEPNDVSPIAFDFTLESDVPPILDDHAPTRSPDGYRLAHDVLRYHAAGIARGWVEVEGTRVDMGDGDWVGFRDHSWGVRPEIGGPIPGVPPGWSPTALEDVMTPEGVASLGFWCPMRLVRADGSVYGIMIAYFDTVTPRGRSLRFFGGEELPTGEVLPFASMRPEVRFDAGNGRFLDGVFHVVTADGVERPISLTRLSETGFHMGTGWYFGYKGHWQGEWRGELFVEGDYYEDCSLPETVQVVHSVRDVLARVDDPVGGGTGFADVQGGARGDHPDAVLVERSG